MQFLWLGALTLSITAVQAFQDTSPFIFFSTSEILASSPQIVSASSLSHKIDAALQECPSDAYVIVSQPGVNAADFSGKHSSPHLRKWASGKDKRIRSSFTVTDVLGRMDTGTMMETLERKCSAGILNVDASTGLFEVVDDVRPRIIKLDFPTLSAGGKRLHEPYENGLFLTSVLDILPSPNFTVIYTTTPISTGYQRLVSESKSYEMDESPLLSAHMDLKRDLSAHPRAASNGSTVNNGPLFEKYQFFTPGIFMGLLAGLILVSILYVGISAVASLQVTYSAFDREMGPAAQKKQQ
ncbi:hypothetical protein MMC14_002055 [Varicellaria rhodocarpa]|nr:hypothetical protein [Varicellaria rhodocarpa]